MATGKFVSYLRVSTARQGRSGLGLDAQRQAVADYLNGGRWKLVKEFVEVESGGRNDRPELARALAACRLYGATLVIAKLDRLSRNTAFLLKIKESAADVVACDMPDAGPLIFTVMAGVAQWEREQISSRTKAALAAAKRRGVKLGNPQHLTRKARLQGTRASATVRGATADKRAEDLGPILSELGAGKGASLKALARGLNAQGIPAPRGGTWSAMQVGRLLSRLQQSA